MSEFFVQRIRRGEMWREDNRCQRGVPASLRQAMRGEKQSLRRWKHDSASVGNDAEMVYHRRPIDCIALTGDTDGGGLMFDMLIPVVGLTIGIAFRTRVAEG